MIRFLVRRGAPLLIAGTALATLPMAGVNAAPVPIAVADAPASSSHVSAVRVVPSLSGLATSGPSAAAGTNSKASSVDGRQSPHRQGGSAAPASGAAAQAATAPLAVPKVAPTAVSGTSTAVRSFNGLNAYQERYVASSGNQFTVTPPDQGLCVGNGYVMESINDAMQVWDTSGHALIGPVGLNAFYGYPPAINRTTGEYGPSITDPTCYFDPQYSRWFQVVLTLDTNPSTGALTLSNHLDIAVSADSNPLSGWIIYRTAVQDDGTQGTPKHTSCPCIGDYPHIGADANGFYVTTNEYPFGTGPGVFGNNYNGAQVYMFSKFWLAQNSSSIPMVHFANLKLSNGTPSFTLWPSENPGTAYDTRNNGTEWFSQSTAAIQETNNPAGMSDNIAVWRITNTASIDSAKPAPAISSKVLTSEVYGVPPPSEQRVGNVPLRDCLISTCRPGIGPSRSEVEGPVDSNDTRMQSAWLANGHLYTALDTIVNVNGRYQAGVAYFIVNVSGAFSATAISNQGYVAVNGNVIYPSIATLADGTGVMAISLVGASYFPSAAYMTVSPTGPTGAVTVAAHGAGPLDDFCQYTFFNCGATPTPTTRPRFGDYGAAAVAGSQLWIASEYVGQTCTVDEFTTDPTCGGTRAVLTNWATRITQVK